MGLNKLRRCNVRGRWGRVSFQRFLCRLLPWTKALLVSVGACNKVILTSMMKSTSLCLSICSVWKFVMRKEMSKPSIGFLRKIKKFSALLVKNLVNCLTRMFSISSACLILMDTRTELMLGSINTFSFSFRAIVIGFNNASGVFWYSTSGVLCRSTTCEAKFSKHNAAVNDCRTAVK